MQHETPDFLSTLAWFEMSLFALALIVALHMWVFFNPYNFPRRRRLLFQLRSIVGRSP